MRMSRFKKSTRKTRSVLDLTERDKMWSVYNAGFLFPSSRETGSGGGRGDRDVVESSSPITEHQGSL
jgi:hypothetical protein